jgi:hypothetical protein
VKSPGLETFIARTYDSVLSLFEENSETNLLIEIELYALGASVS